MSFSKHLLKMGVRAMGLRHSSMWFYFSLVWAQLWIFWSMRDPQTEMERLRNRNQVLPFCSFDSVFLSCLDYVILFTCVSLIISSDPLFCLCIYSLSLCLAFVMYWFKFTVWLHTLLAIVLSYVFEVRMKGLLLLLSCYATTRLSRWQSQYRKRNKV